LIAEDRKEVHGVVQSAEPLTDDQFQRICAKMQNLVAKGEKLVVSREVNPKLLGGFKIRIGFLEQDLSVATQIGQFHSALKTAFANKATSS